MYTIPVGFLGVDDALTLATNKRYGERLPNGNRHSAKDKEAYRWAEAHLILQALRNGTFYGYLNPGTPEQCRVGLEYWNDDSQVAALAANRPADLGGEYALIYFDESEFKSWLQVQDAVEPGMVRIDQYTMDPAHASAEIKALLAKHSAEQTPKSPTAVDNSEGSPSVDGVSPPSPEMRRKPALKADAESEAKNIVVAECDKGISAGIAPRADRIVSLLTTAMPNFGRRRARIAVREVFQERGFTVRRGRPLAENNSPE